MLRTTKLRVPITHLLEMYFQTLFLPCLQVCTFFVRTGTCAYGEACRFMHPLNCLPPKLNSRGYPLRIQEPDCAHFMKKVRAFACAPEKGQCVPRASACLHTPANVRASHTTHEPKPALFAGLVRVRHDVQVPSP